MLDCIEQVHLTNFLHRDVKPDNFVCSETDPSLLSENDPIQISNYKTAIIDFGTVKQYLNEDQAHIIEKQVRNQRIGTLFFMSIKAHDGYEISRRDDIESFVYTCLYLRLNQLNLLDRHCWFKIEEPTLESPFKSQQEHSRLI